MSIEVLKGQIQSLNQQISDVRSRIDSLKGEKDRIRGYIDQHKDERRREIEMAKTCRHARDFYYADIHNMNAERIKEDIDNDYGQLNYYNSQLEPLYSEKESLINRRNELKSQLNLEYEDMNRRKAERQSMYGETICKFCGTTIRYNKTYGKVPSLCRACKEKENAKWKTKSCKKCGAVITYNTE